MQRFSQRESVPSGYSPQATFTASCSSPEMPRRSSVSDIDFHDVFGGAPRRPLIQETKYGFGETENNTDHSSPAFKRSDEPVVASSSRNPWSCFSKKPVFDEEGMARIRRSKSDFFHDIFQGNHSSSSSRKYEMNDPFAPSSRLIKPARSLSPKPEPFGSSFPAQSRLLSLPSKVNKGMDLPNLTTSKSKDGASNGLSYLRESTNPTKHVETETKCNPNGDSSSLEISKNDSRFHFSIYKWANIGGVSVAIPLRGSDKLKGKDKLQRCSSANGWITSESKAREPKDKLHNCKSFRVEHGKSENVGLLIDSRNEDGGPGQVIEEGNITKSESEIINKLKSTDKNVSKGKVSAVEKATHKPQPKPLNLIFNDDYDDEQGNDEITRNCGSKDISKMSAKKQDVKKRDTSKNVEASTTRIKHSPRNSWDDTKARVRGKVKEFIKIFNQDASSKPRTDTALPENHGSSRKERGTVQPEIETSISMNKRIEKIHLNNALKKKSYSDIPAANHMCNGASEKNINSSVNDTVSDGFKTIVEDPAESFDNYILVEELRPEEKILPQFGIDPEEIMAIDDKIQQWSDGKQGNIRSLLSTLQYVLWPDSGWKSVPLVDIIEGPSVKRSYQKALLCLHPDKLQQKSAASDKKYIAQRVFDILQDAWTHFNSLGSV
ncbi:hypothetical protein E1A91_D05G210700v1 [Gossypium mustelinum]|uniref:J domain-containing protein n=1 Tax=Gossypium mustelinum TaxID=34275 RepID=A0A5D2UYY2_GOSMU|nr:hypothetical protein E1A91_D05G210700v1 [Gossypium mustelinum]